MTDAWISLPGQKMEYGMRQYPIMDSQARLQGNIKCAVCKYCYVI